MEDIVAILFTSGSTGVAKGVQLTMQNLFKSAELMGTRLGCTSQDIVLDPLPCCHAFGMLAGVIMPFTFGGKLLLMEKHSPSKALSLIESEGATVHLGVPTMYFRELEELKQNSRNISTLRAGIVAGAHCPVSIIEEFDTKYNCKILNSYGSTEAMMVCMSSIDADSVKRYHTSGDALEGVEISVLGENGEFVGPNVTGELLVKGEGLMKGYYKLPNETKRVIDDNGWFYTGDIITVDSSGHIKIVGRKKNMIIRGGNNIYPAQVEEIYYSHPSVLEVCILGVPDSELGEQTYAFISLKKNSMETEESLKKYAEGKIAKYKIPDKIVLLASLPKLDNGKIDNQTLLKLSEPITV
ncbi:AMP-binding protein [Bacillus sp. B15-48]|nr:AMP-binding protein [Bacillus sp. B15-48]